MDSSLRFDTINLEWSIVYVDPDKMSQIDIFCDLLGITLVHDKIVAVS